MRAGAVRNLLSGKMVRLLLLQVQALKLQSLRAMDTLDRLVDSNKLNLQLFATLPACLLAVAASRLARAGATALRARRLLTARAAHAEVGELLHNAERALTLAGDGTLGAEGLGLLVAQLAAVSARLTWLGCSHATLRWELQELLGAAARLPAGTQARLLRLAMARHARLSVG